MFYNDLVDIPGEAGKIIIQNGTYVLFETGRNYNPEKKYNVPVRVSIGKICNEHPGKMYPNEKFYLYFPDAQIPETIQAGKRSGCLRIGAFLVIEKIIREYGIDVMLQDIFGADSGLFEDFMAYSIIMENNAAQYYPDYAYNHPLFTEGFHIYSDSKLSDFFHEISDDQRIRLLDRWNREKGTEERIYISYDSTNKNCQAGEIEIAEMGHAKDDKSKPVVNVSIGYNHNNRMPLFYEEYPGSIVDISQLKYMVDKAYGYGYKDVGFILDRGYFCKGNLRYLDEKKMPFVIMAKGNANFINGFVKKARGTFEDDRTKRIGKYHVSGKTIKTKLFRTDEKDRYIHVYYNELRAAIERENMEGKIERLERNYKKWIGKDKKLPGADRYFQIERGKDGMIAAVIPKNKVIEQEKRMCGYFVIVTSKRMTAKEALYLYKSRDESEKLFRADKTHLGNHCIRVQSDESLKAKTLIEFMALIVRNKIYTDLDEAMEKNEIKANYMTVPAALKELEKIEMVRGADGIYRMDHAVTKTQRIILKSFGMDSKTVQSQSAKISQNLAQIDGLSVKK